MLFVGIVVGVRFWKAHAAFCTPNTGLAFAGWRDLVRISRRAERIEPFYVMEVGKAAAQLAREVAGSDRPVIALNIGEPDFTAPPLVQEAALRAIRDGTTQYTSALGLDALRERISDWYRQRFGIEVPARRIVVTAGASAALQLVCLDL